MNLKKIIPEIFGNAVAQYGFTLDPSSSNGMWVYSRVKKDVKQELHVQKNRFSEAFYLRYTTSAWGVRTMDAKNVIPMGKYKLYPYGISASYHDVESLKLILHEFVEIVEEYILSELDRLSVEEKVIPSVEMADKLLSSHLELSEKFAKQCGVGIADNGVDDVEKLFDVINAIITETRNLPYEGVQDQLVDITAFLGEKLKRKHDGAWMIGGDNRNIMITGLGNMMPAFTPLSLVVESWKNQDITQLKVLYLAALKNEFPNFG